MQTKSQQRISYIICDYVSSLLATLAFNVIRFLRIYGPEGYASFIEWNNDPHVAASYAVFPVLTTAVFAIIGFYNQPFYKSRYDIVSNAAIGSLISALAIYFAIMVDNNYNERSLHYSLLIALFLSYSLITSLSRLGLRSILLRSITSDDSFYSVVVVGNGHEAVSYALRLEANNKRVGFKVTAVANINPDKAEEDKVSLIPIICLSELEDYKRTHNIDAFVVMASHENYDESLQAINAVSRFGATVLLPAHFYNFTTTRPKLTNIIGEPLVDITSPSLSPATANLKRIGDIAASVFASLILIPVIAVLAVLIKRDSPGPAFYRQERVGLRGKRFRILKLRTMVENAESNGPALSSENDTRVTRMGRFLRKYRLDELPQFWNVIKGDMSLVGPRPERQHFIDLLSTLEPSVHTLHNVRPGITSLGMVKYGYASDIKQMSERLRFDLLYVENMSFGLDLKILFHTVNTVLTGKGI